MTPNLGILDRTLRIAAGAALIVLATLGKIGLWGYVGVIPFVTGIFRFCPAYRLFGFSSCPLPSGKH